MTAFKLFFFFGLLALSISSAHSVEGYKDIYLDREQDIVIHSVFCGDLNKLNSLRPFYVYTNSTKIDEGTYYYSTVYGNYSFTFKPIEGQPDQLRIRGLLKAGQTKKEQMVVDNCLVAPLQGLPPKLLSSLKQTMLTPNDPNWDKTMIHYGSVAGRPAFASGVYEDPRSTAKKSQYDQKVHDANQQYLEAAEQRFASESEKLQNDLPKKLEDAIKYALQEDGATTGKIYPTIEKPAVWTATSKQIYNDTQSRQRQEMDWDKVIQDNFNWLFTVVGKDNDLKSTQLVPPQPALWNGQILKQRVTVAASFENGKSLELDFVIKSEKVNRDAFDSLETIAVKSNTDRKSIIGGTKKIRDLADPTTVSTLIIYSPTKKVNLFFSPFRGNKIGDYWRYR
jgi:hypothetical protein